MNSRLVWTSAVYGIRCEERAKPVRGHTGPAPYRPCRAPAHHALVAVAQAEVMTVRLQEDDHDRVP